MDVKGRPRRSYVIKLIPGDGCLLIRLDDDDDDAFWQEIRITETELLRLTAAVHRKTHGVRCEQLPDLDDLPQQLPDLDDLPDLPTP